MSKLLSGPLFTATKLLRRCPSPRSLNPCLAPLSFQGRPRSLVTGGFTMSSYLSGKLTEEFYSDPELDYDANKHLRVFLSDFFAIRPEVVDALEHWKRGDDLGPLLGEMNIEDTMEEHQKEPLKLKDVVKRLEQIAPLSLAEPWDNVGLLIEPHDTNRPIVNILLTIDLTDEVLQEAVENKTDLIISYHPPVFAPLKRVNNDKWKERVVSTCLAHNIAVFSPHTSWDAIQGGINDWLASIYHIKNYYPLSPSKPDGFGHLVVIGHSANETDVVEHLTHIAETAFGSKVKDSVSVHGVANTSTHALVTDADLGAFLTGLYASGRKYESVTVAKRPLSPSKTTGSGRMVELMEPIPLLKAIKKMKAHLNKLVLRVAIPQGRKENEIMIHSVAVCAGAGGSLLKNTQADLWITGEMSHHDILDATHRGITVLLLEHSDSERGYLRSFRQMLKVRLHHYLDPLNVTISNKDRDPIGYV